jgi:tetratricopeptide (TPR) repeat protein
MKKVENKMNAKRSLTFPLLSLFLAAPALVLAAGGSRMDPAPAEQEEEKTPAQLAAEHYNEGLADRDAAFKDMKALAATDLTPDKRKKLERKVQNGWERAIEEFSAATQADPTMHQAWSDLGHALRQTGDYTQALEAYRRALSIKPDYAQALEYLGEAYLGLGQIDNAKDAYAKLEASKSKLGPELLSAMQAWVAQKRKNPAGGVTVGQLDEFGRWIDERLEGQPVPSSLNKPRSW